MDLSTEGATAQLHHLAEEAQDLLKAAVVAGELVGSCGVPEDVFIWPGCCAWRQAGGRGDPAGPEGGLLTLRQLDVDDI